MDIDKELFRILTDYGDFFLTDYPSQAETKSVHPTAGRIKDLFKQWALEMVGADIIGEDFPRTENEKSYRDGWNDAKNQVRDNINK